jgi:receptor tyrosine kinase-like orphan receptor 1
MSTTVTGFSCLPWNRKSSIKTSDFVELVGGHNYCRNPSVVEMDGQVPIL